MPALRRAHLWGDLPLAGKGAVVVAIPLVALVMAVGTFLQAQNSSEAADEVVARNLQTERQLAIVRNLTVDGEAAVRGFKLTGDRAFLTPLDEAEERMDGETARLRQLVADDPALAGPAVMLQDLTRRRLAIARELRDTDGADDARVQQVLVEGQDVTDMVRRLTAEMERVQAVKLDDNRQVADDANRRVRIVSVAALVLGILGGIAALLVYLRGVGRRIAVLRDNAEELAQGRTLRPLPRGRDEIGQLGTALEGAGALLREREDELRAASASADHANRAKTEFLSRVSHELRTPLNGMLGFAQILAMGPLSEAQADDVEQILRGGRHLVALINEVLDISRIETGDLALSIEPVALAEVMGETRRLLDPLAARRNVKLVEDASVARAGFVLADRQRLTQVLLNLISNAVKYNHEGGSVLLAAAPEEGGFVQILVTDTGPGISDDNQQRLFSPFERLGAERTNVEGAGIGLALSRRLAEAMGGVLSVDSRVGHGSTFSVRVPAAPRLDAEMTVADSIEHHSSIDLRPDPTDPGDQDGVVVLCIDDNVANIRLVEVALGHMTGVRVFSAAQGQLGIDLAREHRPDLVLLDLHLPDLSGRDVLRILRSDPRTAQIPIIAVSADATPGGVERVLDEGAQAFLAKPLNVAELLAWVHQTTGATMSPRSPAAPNP